MIAAIAKMLAVSKRPRIWRPTSSAPALQPSTLAALALRGEAVVTLASAMPTTNSGTARRTPWWKGMS